MTDCNHDLVNRLGGNRGWACADCGEKFFPATSFDAQPMWPEHGLSASEWSHADRAAAAREGWALFESNERGIEIERCDDDWDERFASDEEALQHVEKRAAEGSDMHQRALKINARANPKEG